MNIVTTCLFCNSPIPPKSGPGKPPKFCKTACRVAYARAAKQPSEPIPAAAKPVLDQLQSLKQKQAIASLTHSKPVLSKFSPYMPTQNDANILALILHGSEAALPYPDNNAVPLSQIPNPVPIPPFKDKPVTF